jgi:2-hydroxychromene-2-carboxylate isomerase
MQIPFYYDYACPWAYLGSTRAEAYFGGLGVQLDFRPILLSIVREPAPVEGAPAPAPAAPTPRKARNAAADIRHWADLCGAEFSPAARERRPSSSLLARAALVAKDAGRHREFHYPAYRARWAEARDIADPQVVRELLVGAGLDGERSLERAQSAELEQRISADSNAAIARGVFGVPTVFVGDEMFWGNDRFELARHYIRKVLG